MFQKRCLPVVVVLTLFLLLVPACGGDGGEKTPTPTQTSAITHTSIPSPTATPTSLEPVRIGVIGPWSGPVGVSGMLIDQIIAVVEWQVKNKGGILGGREVRFIRGDDGGIISQSVAQAKKLTLDNKVTILTLGGISAAHFTAVANAAEELKVPYVPPATINGVTALKYSACPTTHESFINPIAGFVTEVLKPKTVAWLGFEGEDTHKIIDGAEGTVGLRDRLKAKGIDVIHEEYVPLDVVDLTPYLTKIQYKKPDVLVSFIQGLPQTITINKQIMELGGWGNIKYLAAAPTGAAQAAIKMPSAVGTYVLGTWLPGSDDSGMKAFEDAFKQVHGRMPTFEITFTYNALWIAIKAIELAGTDEPGKVAEALRSGNLEVDSAWGPLRMGADGKGKVPVMVAQVQEGGKLVEVWTWNPE